MQVESTPKPILTVDEANEGTISAIFSLLPVVPCFPLLGLTPSGLFMGLSST